MIIECQSIDSSSELRQGDVLEWINKETNWKEFAVIITADCDLARNKNDNIFSYCPVLSLESYIENYFINKKIKNKTIDKEVKKIIDDYYKSNGNIDSDIDLDLIIESIISQKKLQLIMDIKPPKPRQDKILNFFIKYYSNNSNPFDLYIDYQEINKNQKNKALDKLVKDTQDYIKKLVAFFLRDLIFMLYLRKIFHKYFLQDILVV